MPLSSVTSKPTSAQPRKTKLSASTRCVPPLHCSRRPEGLTSKTQEPQSPQVRRATPASPHFSQLQKARTRTQTAPFSAPSLWPSACMEKSRKAPTLSFIGHQEARHLSAYGLFDPRTFKTVLIPVPSWFRTLSCDACPSLPRGGAGKGCLESPSLDRNCSCRCLW